MRLCGYSGVFNESSLQEAMRLMKFAGFDGIEIMYREPHLSGKTTLSMLKELRNLAKYELGLEIPIISGYMAEFATAGDQECRRMLSEFEKMTESAAVLGAEVLGLSIGGPSLGTMQRYHVEKAAYWIRLCAERAGNYHKKIVVDMENEGLTETVDSSMRLIDSVGAVNAGVTHSACSLYSAGVDYGKDSVLRMGQRLFRVYVNDRKKEAFDMHPGTFVYTDAEGKKGLYRHTLLNDGEVDHRPVLEALKQLGYKRWITVDCWPSFLNSDVEEPFVTHAPFEGIVHNLKQLKKQLDD